MTDFNVNNEKSTTDRLINLILTRLPFDKVNKLTCNDISLFRHNHPTEIPPCIYEPSIALILQGGKRVTYAEQTIEYSAGMFLLTSMDLPVSSEITDATLDKPYLSILFTLNMKTVFAIFQKYPDLGHKSSENYEPLKVCNADSKLMDAFVRLLELYKEQGMRELLAPLIQTEIIIRLLASPAGHNLRAMLHNNTSIYKIANAVNWFKENYAEAITMDMLAAKVHMNTSTFRQLFKKVTSISPLQYLKTIRLQNARNFLLSEDIDAASAAIRVGYESVSQFSREYKRYFGTPPKQDVKNIRSNLN